MCCVMRCRVFLMVEAPPKYKRIPSSSESSQKRENYNKKNEKEKETRQIRRVDKRRRRRRQLRRRANAARTIKRFCIYCSNWQIQTIAIFNFLFLFRLLLLCLVVPYLAIHDASHLTSVRVHTIVDCVVSYDWRRLQLACDGIIFVLPKFVE